MIFGQLLLQGLRKPSLRKRWLRKAQAMLHEPRQLGAAPNPKVFFVKMKSGLGPSGHLGRLGFQNMHGIRRAMGDHRRRNGGSAQGLG